MVMEKQMYRIYLTHQKTRRSVRWWWWCERVVVTMLRSHDCYSRGDALLLSCIQCYIAIPVLGVRVLY